MDEEGRTYILGEVNIIMPNWQPSRPNLSPAEDFDKNLSLLRDDQGNSLTVWHTGYDGKLIRSYRNLQYSSDYEFAWNNRIRDRSHRYGPVYYTQAGTNRPKFRLTYRVYKTLCQRHERQMGWTPIDCRDIGPVVAPEEYRIPTHEQLEAEEQLREY
jgi:hypothetical protein